MTSVPAQHVVSAHAAKHIIQRLGETGQPPERGALAVNVGTDEFLRVLRDEYLVPMKEFGRNSSFKLVQAPFGGGKTQFLHCLREVAWCEGFATALVGVSPQECPFDDPRKIYEAVIRAIESPPGSPDDEPATGLDVLLRDVARDRAQRYGKEPFREWLRDEFAHARVESRAFLRAVRLFMESVLDDEPEREELLRAYLFGEIATSRELLELQIRERMGDDNAFRFLRSLVQTLRALETTGVVLLFDELDRVLSLTVRRRKAIGDNLRQMIDHCGQSVLPSLLWVYAVPPEFLQTVVPEYPALQQRLKGAARFGSSSPLQPIIDLDRLPLGPTELLAGIGERLLELYELGFDCRFDRGIQESNLRALASEYGESFLETGTRREFVKAAVQLLTSQHRDREVAFEAGDIVRLAGREGTSGPPAMDGEDLFA